MNQRKGLYEDFFKRFLDIVCSSFVIIFFSWLYAIIAILVRIKLGKPIIFKQLRPGKIDPKTGRERMFFMYKFRSMTDDRDDNGNLLPDKDRLGKFGKMLRETSLDELPEVLNILKGDMSIIGPRPQLIKDMVFMSKKQRRRHLAKPGMSGLAQVKGRNAITWEEKIYWDLKYVSRISFLKDLKIFFDTIAIVFKRSGITDGENATALDYGDVLLKSGKISELEYEKKQKKAREIIANHR